MVFSKTNIDTVAIQNPAGGLCGLCEIAEIKSS